MSFLLSYAYNPWFYEYKITWRRLWPIIILTKFCMENFLFWIKSSGNNVNLHSLGTHAVNVVRVKQLYFQNFDWSLMQTTKIVNFTVFFWPVAKSDWAMEKIRSVCATYATSWRNNEKTSSFLCQWIERKTPTLFQTLKLIRVSFNF